jgi:hypothetical protein
LKPPFGSVPKLSVTLPRASYTKQKWRYEKNEFTTSSN